MTKTGRFLRAHYTRLDRGLLLWLILPATAALLGMTLHAVASVVPFSFLSLLDFLRLHVAFLAAIVLWCGLLLRVSASQHFFRAVTLVYFLMFAGESLSAISLIHMTGANVPSSVVLYSARAVGVGYLSLPVAETVFALVVPSFIVWLAAVKWYLLAKANGDGYRLPRPSSLGALSGLFILTVAPPLHPDLELNTARPSYLYKIVEHVKQLSLLSPAVAKAEQSGLEPIKLAERANRETVNLVFIVLESVGLRATNLGNPGLQGVTPFLQKLSESSRVFDRAYTVVPHTSKALVAMFCGTEPFFRFPIFESHLGIPARCLASLLDDHGYQSVFFQSPNGGFENRRGLVAQMGFQRFVGGDELSSAGFEVVNYFGYEDAVMLEPSRQWLGEQKAPFLAVYLTGATHHSYWPPSRLEFEQFADASASKDKNRYLNSVHYLDWFVDQLIRQYKDVGLYDNTIFVIVGDHGESFEENTRRQHNASLYEETLAVPLLIHSPARVRAGRDSRIVSLTDILPSLADMMGFDLIGRPLGVSFWADAPGRESAIASCWYDDWCVANVDKRYKYIFNFGEKKEELYDIETDPEEKVNIANQHPGLTARRREEALRHHRENIARYDRFYSNVRADYWSARGDSVAVPASLLSLPADDPRNANAGFR